jgi:methanogenic corrinoid protein MtbC1
VTRNDSLEKRVAQTALFEAYFDRLMALVHERMEIAWRSHRRADIAQMESDLLELLREFGELLRVTIRFDLPEALRHEAGWYASVLAARGPGRDALALLLESWIVAIQGLIKPPECNALAAPLQALRQDLPALFAQVETAASVSVPPAVRDSMAALSAGDRAAILDIVRQHIAAGHPGYDAVPSLVLAAMSAIGHQWEANRIPIYREHLATETALQVLAALPSLAPGAPLLSRKALVSCVPRDHMQITTMALTIYLQMRGWSAASLGQGLPAQQIAEAAHALQPDALFLSLAMVSRLGGALEVIERLKDLAHPPLVIFGGRGAQIGRRLIVSAGGRVADDFDGAHRMALGAGGPHA